MSFLQAYSTTHGPEIQRVLKTFFAKKRAEASALTPHLAQSVDVLSEFVFRGGKMIRPLVVLLACQLAGKKIDEVIYQVAAAVEVFHKHILNLDDMADRDEVRYGGPTIWKRYEEIFQGWNDAPHHARSFSEIDGTLLGSFAFDLVRTAKVSDAQKLAVMDIFIRQMYFETVAGWQIHYYQNQQQLAEASEEEFIHGLDLVTSRYTFVGPLQIGLVLAEAERSPLATALERYGLDVGLAFQVTDDILGLFGDPAETGKAVGNDVREGKKTLLLQRAYQLSNEDDRLFLSKVCGQVINDTELARVQTIVEETGSLEYSKQLAQERVQRGKAELPSPDSQNATEAYRVLVELADMIVSRKK